MAESKIEKNRVLIIEQANIEIKDLINNSMLLGFSKSYTKLRAKEIIDRCISDLKDLDAKDKAFLQAVELSLKKSFLRLYTQMVTTLQIVARRDKIGLVRQTLEKMDVPFKTQFKKAQTNAFTVGEITPGVIGMEQEEITNLRDFMTVYDEGAAGTYTDYVSDVQKNIINIEQEIVDGTLTLQDSKGRTKSIRNMAEIKTRYELIQGDMNRLASKGVKYVVATAHANCSERCSHHQGKTFIFDLENLDSREMYAYDPTKAKALRPIDRALWIDGRETWSLKEAIECGFMSYNCQHRVVAYHKGIQAPTYSADQVEKKRDISQKQRMLENEIRKAKQAQVLMTGKARKEAIARSKKLQTAYDKFCKDNRVPNYLWRCQITEVERNFNPVLQEK